MVEEPKGYVCEPGFVKSRPENNQVYINKCAKYFPDHWMEAIRKIDSEIEGILPGYNISQIKEKFHTMRYYIDPPHRAYEEDTSDDEVLKIFELLDQAYAIIDRYTLEAGSIIGSDLD